MEDTVRIRLELQGSEEKVDHAVCVLIDSGRSTPYIRKAAELGVDGGNMGFQQWTPVAIAFGSAMLIYTFELFRHCGVSGTSEGMEPCEWSFVVILCLGYGVSISSLVMWFLLEADW